MTQYRVSKFGARYVYMKVKAVAAVMLTILLSLEVPFFFLLKTGTPLQSSPAALLVHEPVGCATQKLRRHLCGETFWDVTRS